MRGPCQFSLALTNARIPRRTTMIPMISGKMGSMATSPALRKKNTPRNSTPTPRPTLKARTASVLFEPLATCAIRKAAWTSPFVMAGWALVYSSTTWVRSPPNSRVRGEGGGVGVDVTIGT